MSNAGAEAIASLDALRDEWLSDGRRLAECSAAADTETRCVLLPVLAANVSLSLYSREGHELARRHLARGQALAGDANARERAWLGATEAWLDGDTGRCLQTHEEILGQWPTDLLAGKIGQFQALDGGDAEAVLRIGERLSAANPDNRHALVMHAFGLQECNRLEEAEPLLRRVLAVEARDARAHRGLAMCLQSRGRMLDAVAFLESMSKSWEDCDAALATGNWRQLALLLIDLDRADEALSLFDRHVWAAHREACETQIDAVALLARLELRGIDVGERWADVAAALKPHLHDHFVPRLDLHYLYGFARAGEQSAVTEMLASLEDRAASARPFEREAWADGAVPAAHGLAAYAKGDPAEAARLLGQATPHLQKIGGSNAQRALFGALHLDALMKSGWNDAALAILQADERERPTVPWTKRSLGDLYRRVGRTQQALAADYQAEQLARRYAKGKTP